MEGMISCTQAAVERAMKVQEVILRALAKITWWAGGRHLQDTSSANRFKMLTAEEPGVPQVSLSRPGIPRPCQSGNLDFTKLRCRPAGVVL
jgi:hypothetical protein